MTHPWAGLDPAELVDVRPLCRPADRRLPRRPRAVEPAPQVQRRRRRARGPRPALLDPGHELRRRRKPDGSVAFRWLLAGTQGQNPRICLDAAGLRHRGAGARGPPADLAQVFNDEGSREKRDKARLRYLIEKIGDDGFLDRVEARLGYRLERTDEPDPQPPDEAEDFVGWFRQKQPGLWALGVNVPLGRLTHEQLDGLAELAEKHRRRDAPHGLRPGDRRSRTSRRPQGRRGPCPEPARTGARGRHGRAEHHRLHRAAVLQHRRQRDQGARLRPDGPAPGPGASKLAGIKINMSGCPSSCAMTYLGDIGLKGVRVRRKAGTRDGFDVFLGGGVHEAGRAGPPLPQGGRRRPAPRDDRRIWSEPTTDEHEGDADLQPVLAGPARRGARRGPATDEDELPPRGLGLREVRPQAPRRGPARLLPQVRRPPHELRPARPTRPRRVRRGRRRRQGPARGLLGADGRLPRRRRRLRPGPRRPAGGAGRRPRAGPLPGRRPGPLPRRPLPARGRPDGPGRAQERRRHLPLARLDLPDLRRLPGRRRRRARCGPTRPRSRTAGSWSPSTAAPAPASAPPSTER